MTQYMLSVWHKDLDAGVYATPEDMQRAFEQVDLFNKDLEAAGAWVFGGGLMPPASATVVDATGDKVAMTDGPYAESKEQIGGFWVIEAADLDAALAWAKKASAACMNAVEVRPFQGE